MRQLVALLGMEAYAVVVVPYAVVVVPYAVVVVPDSLAQVVLALFMSSTEVSQRAVLHIPI